MHILKYKQLSPKGRELAQKITFDSATSNTPKQKEKLCLDSATAPKANDKDAAELYELQQISADAMDLTKEWLETTDDDLDTDEGFGDRLLALVVGLVDNDKDGEITDDEMDVIEIGLNSIAEYMTANGISEKNADELLDTFDNDLAESVHEMLLEKAPNGDDELGDELDKVTFSAAENGDILDSVETETVLDAAYRKAFAIRGGKKVKIRKRIAGKVRLSAKQKQAIRKAQRKAHTGAARMRRLKSLKMRKRMGLK